MNRRNDLHSTSWRFLAMPHAAFWCLAACSGGSGDTGSGTLQDIAATDVIANFDVGGSDTAASNEGGATASDAAASETTANDATRPPDDAATGDDTANQDVATADASDDDGAVSDSAVSGDAGGEDAAAEDVAAQDATSQDATSQDAASQDAASQDIGDPDVAADAGPPDTTATDSAATDTSSADTGSADAASDDAASACEANSLDRCWVECVQTYGEGCIHGDNPPRIAGVRICNGGTWGPCATLATCAEFASGPCDQTQIKSKPIDVVCLDGSKKVGAMLCIKPLGAKCGESWFGGYGAIECEHLCLTPADQCPVAGETRDCEVHCDTVDGPLKPGTQSCQGLCGPNVWGPCMTGDACLP